MPSKSVPGCLALLIGFLVSAATLPACNGNHSCVDCADSGGTPAIDMSGDTACAPGFVDADRNPANGCEYPCVPTAPTARCASRG